MDPLPGADGLTLRIFTKLTDKATIEINRNLKQ